MTTRTEFSRIIFDFAAQHPSTPVDVLTDSIVSTIESEDFLVKTVEHVKLPTSLDVKLTELRSKRLPARQRAPLSDKVANVHLFKRIKEMTTPIIATATLNPTTHPDGANITLNYTNRYPDTTFTPSIKSLGYRYNRPYQAHEWTTLPGVATQANPFVFTSNKNSGTENITIIELLQQMDSKFDELQLLSLYDFYQLISIIKTYNRLKELLPYISKILSRDFELRKIQYGISSLDQYLDSPDPNKNNNDSFSAISQIFPVYISNILKTLIVHEYSRLHDETGKSFIDRNISYESYIQITERYAFSVNSLLAEFC